MKICDHR